MILRSIFFRCTRKTNIFIPKKRRKPFCWKLQRKQKILREQNCRIYCNLIIHFVLVCSSFSFGFDWSKEASVTSQVNRNEAGILTARKDLDYIGREELLEALKRVRCCKLWRKYVYILILLLHSWIMMGHCSKKEHLRQVKRIQVKSPRSLNWGWLIEKLQSLFLHVIFQIPTALSWE